MLHFTQPARAHESDRLVERLHRAVLRAGLEYALVGAHGFDQRTALAQRQRNWLFAVDVLPAFTACTEIGVCQWSGVATTTASMSARANISR